MERRPSGVDHVFARVGGAQYRVDLPMTNQTLRALAQAQSGREANLTNQMRLVQITSRPDRVR